MSKNKDVITFESAIKWLNRQKKDNSENFERYNRFYWQLDDLILRISTAETELSNLSDTIELIKNSVIVSRANKELMDSLVISLNNNIDVHNTLVDEVRQMTEEASDLARHIRNYNLSDEKELWFFWLLLHDLLPSKTPQWIEFEKLHGDIYCKRNVDDQAIFNRVNTFLPQI